jgi:SsrA-binding protein
MADIVTNSKARRDYIILDTYEAGIVLHGTEVKALRAGKGQIGDAFARVEDNQGGNCSCTRRKSENSPATWR